MIGRGSRIAMVLALVAPLSVGGAACDTCDKKQCWQPGVYLRLGLTPEAATATICIDDDCSTFDVERNPDVTGADQKYALYVADVIPWEGGRKVDVTIDVFDASGATIAHLSGRRTMQRYSGACSPCPSFLYRSENGELVHD